MRLQTKQEREILLSDRRIVGLVGVRRREHTMQCHLCLQDRDLCDSHILPEFLYRPGYDENHRVEVLTQSSHYPSFIQKGIRQKLLCQECENLLANTYEDYFSSRWYLHGTLPGTFDLSNWHLEGLDYAPFKLFHLSILWRASISTHAAFSQVSLGSTAERIRLMLLNKQPGSDDDFQIFGVLLLFPSSNQVCDGFIASPTRQVRDGHPLHMFVFGGCVWHYYESSGDPNPLFAQIALSPDGSMTFPVSTLDKVTPLARFFEDYVRIQRDARL